MKNAEEETAILKEYNKRYQEAFNSILVFEGELRVIIRQIPAGQAELYAEVVHTLPRVEHWLDCMVHGEFGDQVKAVKYAENFIRRLILE